MLIMQYWLWLVMQQTADQSGSSSAALFPLWSLLARCLPMIMVMRMMMALLGLYVFDDGDFFSAADNWRFIFIDFLYMQDIQHDLYIHHHFLWCLLSPLYAGNGIEHRPGGSDHQTHHQEPGIVGVVHIKHGAWRFEWDLIFSLLFLFFLRKHHRRAS